VKLRLAATSVLEESALNGRYIITEILTGKGAAIGAMAFAGFALMVMAMPLLGSNTIDKKFVAYLVAIFATMIIGISLLLIRNTWRRTIVSADPQTVEVIFAGPLSSTRRYASPTMSIEKIEIVHTDVYGVLGELRIAPLAGAELHLFTDHALRDVKRLADSVLQATAGAAAITITVIPMAEPAPRSYR